jgi:phosphonate transport system substrate-binding protein
MSTTATTTTTAATTTRYRLSVSPHDTAKHLAGWFLLNTYLQRKLGVAMRFEPSDNFEVEQEQVMAGGFHLAYANPFSALKYVHERGFVPVARPVGVYDETLLVARQGAGLPAQRPLRVASASEQLLVHVLGMTLLDQHQVAPDDRRLQFTGNHVRAVQAVLDGRADVGFVYNETWHGLSTSTREALEIVAATSRQMASHCFCVAPELADRLDDVRDALCGMDTDPSGKKILADLRISGFEAMAANALDHLTDLAH